MQNLSYSSSDADLHQWYQKPLGQQLTAALKQAIEPILDRCFGYYAVMIGAGHVDDELLASARVRHVFTLDNQAADIQASSDSLPIATDSIDLVLLWHSLSGQTDPHALLREVDRVLIPEGKLIIIDFNPFSLWGLRRLLQLRPVAPWRGQYFSRRRLHDWLKLLGFESWITQTLFFAFPSSFSASNSQRWNRWLGRIMPGFGAVNILVYEKRMTPLTPYRHNRLRTQLLPAGLVKPSLGRQMKRDGR